MVGQGEFEQVVMGGQALAQGFPVLLAGLDDLRRAPQLHPADGGLGIERYEILA